MDQLTLMALVRREQHVLSQKLAAELMVIFERLLKENPAKCADYLPNEDFSQEAIAKYDDDDNYYEALRLWCAGDLSRGVIAAIYGYTDWAAVRLVRSKRYGARKLPLPKGKDLAAIAAKYYVNFTILQFVIKRMSKEDALPLLGRKEKGLLVPDKAQLTIWKNQFDWSKNPSRKNARSR